MTQISSNLKRIISGSIPNTTNLPVGNMAFGMVDGNLRIFTNPDGSVREFEGRGSNSENVIKYILEEPVFTRAQFEDFINGGEYTITDFNPPYLTTDLYSVEDVAFMGARISDENNRYISAAIVVSEIVSNVSITVRGFYRYFENPISAEDIDLSGYLPKSAGSSQALTGALYTLGLQPTNTSSNIGTTARAYNNGYFNNLAPSSTSGVLRLGYNNNIATGSVMINTVSNGTPASVLTKGSTNGYIGEVTIQALAEMVGANIEAITEAEINALFN